AVAYLGEMLQYTPGVHLLAALGGSWAGLDGFHAVYPIVAASVALKAGFVYLIGLRTLPRDVPRVPIAAAGVVVLFLPRRFFLGSFTDDSFFAQVVSELFAVAAWWALVLWDERPSKKALVLFALGGIATFLTWPILVGPLMLAFAIVVARREQITASVRLKHLIVGLGPIAIIEGTYLFGRIAWLGMAGTGGAVIRPTPDQFGWWFLVPSLIGLGLAAWQRRGRPTATLAVVCLLQSFALYRFANA